jgi:hypothetical protein
MKKHLKFLKTSSLTVKIAAWFLLLLGYLVGISVILGALPDIPRVSGLIILAVYSFLFFFLQFVSRIADTLVNLIEEIGK